MRTWIFEHLNAILSQTDARIELSVKNYAEFIIQIDFSTNFSKIQYFFEKSAFSAPGSMNSSISMVIFDIYVKNCAAFIVQIDFSLLRSYF